MSFYWRISRKDWDTREEIQASEGWFCFKITVDTLGPEKWIKMYEGQINAKPTAHLTQVDNQVMDKTSRESKLKSNTQTPLK